eukprot:529780-Hanusia_phi.AAC.1
MFLVYSNNPTPNPLPGIQAAAPQKSEDCIRPRAPGTHRARTHAMMIESRAPDQSNPGPECSVSRRVTEARLKGPRAGHYGCPKRRGEECSAKRSCGDGPMDQVFTVTTVGPSSKGT